MILVVVSPHRDDAAFSLGLALQGWMAAGHNASVLNCFTKSEYAPYSDVDALHANDRLSFVSALRRREDLAWSKLLPGSLTLRDLDLLDAPLRLAVAVDEVLTTEIRPGDRALARVEGALEKIASKAPQGTLAFAAPLAVGGHIDHRIAHQAMRNVAERLPVAVAFYEDLPYAARPEEANAPEKLAAALGEAFQPAFATVPADVLETAVHRKSRMVECYDSQIDSDVVRSIAEFCRRYDGRERLWTNAAWRQTALHSSFSGEAR